MIVMVEDPSVLVRGVSPVLEVPFTDEGEIDVPGFRRVLRYVLDTGVSSVMFPGFASEYHKLAEDERRTLTTVLLEQTAARSDVAAIVAVQDHATRLAVARAQEAVAAGADLINLLPPHYLRPSRRAVEDHIRAVRLSQRQADFAVGRERHTVAMLFEQQPEQDASVGVVVDHQDMVSVRAHVRSFPSARWVRGVRKP